MNRCFSHWLLRALWLLSALACQSALAVNQSDLLPADKAFASQVIRQGDHLVLTLDVAEGYYVYRDRIVLTTEPAGLLKPARFPAGKVKNDPYFGKQVIFQQHNRIEIPLVAGAAKRFTLNFKLQGCAQAGVCYPPYTRKLSVGDSETASAGWTTAGWTTAHQTPAASTPGAAQPLTLFAFFIAGLGMAFTACMYPLLPILTALIAGQGGQLSRSRGGVLSLAYVQGLALSYTAVGVIAGLTGSLLTVWLQQPLVVLSASALLVLFALSMFDVFSIQLPAALQSRLANRSNRLSGGRVLTVFGMGVLSALIIGPCIAPPLALALGYIGSTGDALFGGVALYVMALGLGLPLLLVGTFGGHVLPKAGRWMNAIKSVFGVLMLALAIQMASPFLPSALCMLLWSALAIACAVFLHAFDTLPANAHAVTRLGKALGLLLFLLGATELLGVMAGEHNPRYPLAWLNIKPAQAAESALPRFTSVADNNALERQLAAAAGRPVLLDFYADWCVSCKEMDSTTWRDASLRPRLQGFTLLRADVTQNNPQTSGLLKRFGLFGPPAIILIDQKSKVRGQIIGYIDAASLNTRLAAIEGAE